MVPTRLSRTRFRLGTSYLLDSLSLARAHRIRKRLHGMRRHKMAVFANDHIGLVINFFGVYEKDQLKCLFDFLAPLSSRFKAGCVLDIGANIGNHALYFSEIFGRVLAFEPHPHTYKLLELNATFKKNVETLPIGLGASGERARIAENPLNLGGSRISDRDEDGISVFDIEVRRLDDVVRDVASVEMIKLDVEGRELNVLQGAWETIDRHQPVIIFEQLKDEFRENSTPVIDALKERGYRCCWMEKRFNFSASFLRRSLYVFEVLFGREYFVLTADRIPPRFHFMIIAIPPRYVDQLMRG